ncbi:MAG TPA: hypothetical protein VK961_20800 [Chthoniobacter sp.]|nr:hypothetical protein [Chthoniobacter sp.]
MSTESDTHSHPEEGVICPKCLLSNSTTAAFCVECGAPIGMIATIDPIQHIRAEGFAYRAAVDGPPSRIVLVGMWMLFAPFALVGPCIVVNHSSANILELIAWNVASACALVVVYRTTRNYIVKSRLADARNA